MKRVFVLLVLVLFMGCSGDDDGTGDGNGNGQNNNANLRAIGDSAAELLTSNDFNQLEIELISVNGAAPLNQTITNLQTFLQQRLNKPGGIRIVRSSVTDSTGDDYSLEEIDDLEQDNRSSFTNDGTIAVSIIIADKPNERDEGNSVVLGTAYRNTSLVIYQSTIERFSGGLNQPSRVNLESTVYNHEFAHIMGLVNLGTPLQSDHEDDDNENHCNVEGCLMFFEINGGNILDMMNMSGIAQLDPQCLADLRANGGR